jgi:DNA-binding NarL/FixJ family response regulator
MVKQRKDFFSKTWSISEDNTLIRLFEKGDTYQEIGENLGRSAKSVFARVKFLGRQRQEEVNWSEEEILELLRLKLRGYKNYEIAEKLNRPESSIKLKLCRLRKKI